MPGQDAPPAGELAPVTSFAGGLHVDGRRPNANEDGFLFVDAAEMLAAQAPRGPRRAAARETPELRNPQ